jgi:hypothetical protein
LLFGHIPLRATRSTAISRQSVPGCGSPTRATWSPGFWLQRRSFTTAAPPV